MRGTRELSTCLRWQRAASERAGALTTHDILQAACRPADPLAYPSFDPLHMSSARCSLPSVSDSQREDTVPMSNPTPPSQPQGILTEDQTAWLKRYVRSIPDYPQPGVLFRDITPLLQHAPTLRFAIDVMASRYRHMGIEAVVGIDSRGFILGTPLAYILGTGFVPVRKKGKLPGTTITVEYDLEDRSNLREMHPDALQPRHRLW